MPDEITYDEALTFLKRAVEEKGQDYVYPSLDSGKCYYVWDDEPSCIIGQVLAYKYGEVPAIIVENYNNWGIRDLLSGGIVKVDSYETQQLLITAQDSQDDKYTWGRAVARAEDEVKLYASERA